MAEWFASHGIDLPSALWIVGVGAMTNVACALLGCYLVLRRMSLLGDALSHAVLPGLVVAFVLAGSMNLLYLFAGAMLVGLATTFLTQLLHRHGGVPADASMGVVFTSLFALGVILIKRYGEGVHLDADCVFNGTLDFITLTTVTVLGYEVPRTFATIAPVLLTNLLLIQLLWKELKISSFDPALATTMGLRSNLLHYVLMALVAVTTVASFEAVGSILVIAMLIVPGATAHLLTDRLSRMMWIASAVGVAAAVFGYAGAVYFDASTAGMMTVVVGLFYAAAVLLAPRYGVLSAIWRQLSGTLRILREDLLAMLYRLDELAGERRLGPREATLAIGGGWLATVALWSLERGGSVERAGGGLRLTEPGRRRAAQLIRSHRLWEAYLVEHLGLPLDHVHHPAERMEHFIGEELRQKILADLSAADIDPHGRDIPPDDCASDRSAVQ